MFNTKRREEGRKQGIAHNAVLTDRLEIVIGIVLHVQVDDGRALSEYSKS